MNFICNHCGHREVVKNYNPLELYDCEKCGKLTSEVGGTKLDNERHLTADMGGEVGAEVKRLKDLGKVECHGVCFKDTSTDDIRGYEHSGGLEDSYGKKWWVYVHCNNPVMRADIGVCDYDTSWRKIR